MKPLKIKGSFSDLKDSLKSLKGLYEAIEATESPKQNIEELQEADLKAIKRNGQSNNHHRI